MRILIFFFFLITFTSLSAQENDGAWKLYTPDKKQTGTDSTIQSTAQNGVIKSLVLNPTNETGKIEVEKDKRLDDLSKFVGSPHHTHTTVTLKGYRIQAYLDRDKNLVNQKRAEYLGRRENQPVYIDFLAPNFRLRIGDFRTKTDAAIFLERIRGIFPDAIIVMDDIELPVLPN